jgi:hypothetical protein
VTLVAVVILVLYRNFLDGYLWDDDFSLIAAGRTFDPGESFGLFNRHHFYRPLIELYFDAGMAWFGYAPRAFHALNIGLHMVNASLAFFIARRVLGTVSAALAAALFFAVLPAILDTIAWVSAVTALLMTTCYLTAMLAHLTWLETGDRKARAVSAVAFVAALLAHEGAVTLLPMMIIAEYLLLNRRPAVLRQLLWRYAAWAAALACYLAISFLINRGNYVVTEGHYRIGLHGLRNLFDYVSALYVGRRGAIGMITTAALLLIVLRVATPRAWFGCAWMFLALVPYAFFTWSGSGRYAYLSAVGFSLLLAAVMQSVARALRPRLGKTAAAVATGFLVAAVAGRFAVFAARGSSGALAPGESYREWLQAFRQTHGNLPRGALVTIQVPANSGVNVPAITAMVQLEYDDPTLQLQVLPSDFQSR